ncbi:MAG: ABC transporter permease, partial [Verrucomicrobia bacterium]|nr:ABC transporter permease [Verrucomicrobiota bacterium]
MVFVLALLCAFFSFATYTEQHPTSADAARQLANSIATQFGKSARVLIAVPNQPEAAEFAGALQAALTNAGATVIATVKGEPKEARAALQAAASAGKLDAIACTQASAGWLVFADLATDFPALG